LKIIRKSNNRVAAPGWRAHGHELKRGVTGGYGCRGVRI